MIHGVVLAGHNEMRHVESLGRRTTKRDRERDRRERGGEREIEIEIEIESE